ncbi:PREDICTED: secretory carrier-associated membrane protein 4-like [Priapulus caudatus]|uniref:Secretory carrier-associated membrane protein n=1 Tax=Priapulus caudatus TaxID=37621 RepID=A0ABM1E1P4_PRICU|nr:PREDICTED: secretory carrier-associated membrane protein 4-like [Priapulus caudatus]
MAGFDSNPFANQQGDNPFSQGQQQPPPAQSQPAVVPAKQDPPPYTQAAAKPIDTSDLQRRQEELERKEAELSRREAELGRQPLNIRQNNWPPVPGFCPCGPCFYQEFSVDIPTEFQNIVKIFYYLWMFYACLMFLNILGCLAYWITGGSPTTFGLSILFFVLFTPAAFVCWYRPVYKAFRSDSSFNFFFFFFIFFFQFVVSIIQALGFNGFGTCGFFNGLETVSRGTTEGYVVGAIMFFLGLMFGISAVLEFIGLVRVGEVAGSMHEVTGGWFNAIGHTKINIVVGVIMILIGVAYSAFAATCLVLLMKKLKRLRAPE